MEAAAYGAVLETGRGFSAICCPERNEESGSCQWREETKVPHFTRDDKGRGGFNAPVETRAHPRVVHALELFSQAMLSG